jgi:hypothetical protein
LIFNLRRYTLDVIASIPFDLLAGDGGSAAIRSTKFVRIAKLIRLVRPGRHFLQHLRHAF